MNIYEGDTDKFSAEYLAYLASLEVEVFTGHEGSRARISKNLRGAVVRIEVWPANGTYTEVLLGQWMKP